MGRKFERMFSCNTLYSLPENSNQLDDAWSKAGPAANSSPRQCHDTNGSDSTNSPNGATPDSEDNGMSSRLEHAVRTRKEAKAAKDAALRKRLMFETSTPPSRRGSRSMNNSD